MVERNVFNLFEKTSFKKFFNTLYKIYLKNNKEIKNEEIVSLDNYLCNKFSKIKSFKCQTKKGFCLNISQSFTDPYPVEVSIYNKEDQSFSNLSGFSLEDILNSEFCPTIKLTNEEALSHIIFFYLKENELL